MNARLTMLMCMCKSVMNIDFELNVIRFQFKKVVWYFVEEMSFLVWKCNKKISFIC